MSWYWDRKQLPPIDFHTTRQHVAKKEYECGECKETIEPDSTYRYYSGKIRKEDFFTFKMCMPCCSDWDTVLKIFDENLESWEHAEIIFGLLNVAVQELLEAEFIDESHHLVNRWLPDVQQPEIPSGTEQLSLILD